MASAQQPSPGPIESNPATRPSFHNILESDRKSASQDNDQRMHWQRRQSYWQYQVQTSQRLLHILPPSSWRPPSKAATTGEILSCSSRLKHDMKALIIFPGTIKKYSMTS